MIDSPLLNDASMDAVSHDSALFAPALFDASVQQKIFRSLMQAFATPGAIQTLPVACKPLEAVLVCLVDAQVTFADPCALLSDLQRQQLECQMVAASEASFVAADGSAAPEACVPSPLLGTLESPELSATLILRVQAISQAEAGRGLRLSGPGIATACNIKVDGLHAGWLKARNEWNAAFPMGIDMILVSSERVMALPRTTHISGDASWPM